MIETTDEPIKEEETIPVETEDLPSATTSAKPTPQTLDTSDAKPKRVYLKNDNVPRIHSNLNLTFTKSIKHATKVEEEITPAFMGLKLKKSQRIVREIEQAELEKVTLMHHEFEKEPLDESVL